MECKKNGNMKNTVLYTIALSLFLMFYSCSEVSESLSNLSNVNLNNISISTEEKYIFLNENRVETCEDTYIVLSRLKRYCTNKSYKVYLDLGLSTSQKLFVRNVTINYNGYELGKFFNLDIISGYPLERLIISNINLKVSDTTNLLVNRFIGFGFEVDEKYGFTKHSKCFSNIDTIGLGIYTDIIPSLGNASVVEVLEFPISIDKIKKKAKKIKSLRAIFISNHVLHNYNRENCKLASKAGVDLTLVKVEEDLYSDSVLTIGSFQKGDTLLLECE